MTDRALVPSIGCRGFALARSRWNPGVWLTAIIALGGAKAAAQCQFGERATLFDPAGQPLDRFGSAVAMDGAWLAVGAPFSSGFQGGVSLYRLTATGWVSAQHIAAPASSTVLPRFGSSLALQGDTLVVGAPGSVGVANDGAVYVYQQALGSWTLVQVLPPPAGSSERFGARVAVDGNRLVAASEEDANTAQGMAYVFDRILGSWVLTAALSPTPILALGSFGTGLAVAGDVIAVGEPAANSVTIFEFNGQAWQSVRFAGGATVKELGTSVAIQGGVVLVGATSNPNVAGAMIVYEKVGGSWTKTATIRPANSAVGDRFGSALAFDGNAVLAGAILASFGTAGQAGFQPEVGSATLFERQGSSWLEVWRTFGDPQFPGKQFGAAVALDAGAAAVAAPYAFDPGLASGQGRVDAFFASSGPRGFLHAQVSGVSSSQAGTAGAVQGLVLSTCPALPGAPALILGSLSGTSPGVTVNGHHLPLNVDAYTLATVNNPNSVLLNPSFASLDAQGHLSSAFALPIPVPAAVGLTLHHAALVLDPSGSIAVLASNAAAVTIDP